MSQAVKIGGSLWARFWAPSPYFDGADDKVNEGRQYPIYSTVGPNGPTKIVDRPYNSRDTDPVIYNMAILRHLQHNLGPHNRAPDNYGTDSNVSVSNGKTEIHRV